MKNLFLKEASVKKVDLKEVPGGENLERRPFNMSFTDDVMEITPELDEYIKEAREASVEDFNMLSDAFREFCTEEDISDFDFENDDYEIFLDLLSVKDFESILKGTEDSYIKNLAAQYIFSTSVYYLEEKFDEMYKAYKEDGYREFVKSFNWFKKLLKHPTISNPEYVGFLNDCVQAAIEVAYDNGEEDLYSLLVNAVIPAEPFWK